MSMFHIRFGVLVSSLGLLAACGKSTPVQEPKPTATVLSAEVTHGETANDYRIAWETEPSDAAVTIEWSDTPTFEPGSGVAIDVNAGASELSWTADGEPQRRYFSITPENGESVLVAARLLPLEGGRNFRDLGGYETEDGRMVKWGHVFRSGRMSALTDNDYDYLADLGITTICDFRDSDERVEDPTVWAAGDIDYQVFTDAPESDPSENSMFTALLDPNSTPEDVKNSMAEGYWEIAFGEAEGYTKMFDDLAAGRIPLAFNCSAGKDRAGTAAALILTALGVPRETVVHDYSLSDDYVDYMGEFLGPEAQAAAAENPDSPYGFLFQLPPEKVAPLMASHPIYIESTFAKLENDYGSALAFIQSELDVTDTELEQIRTRLLR
ncbi:MAG: tyrosine-protein phosphatase [Pseudomonadota bacterium]